MPGERHDGWLTVGSANLNEHSRFNDTEGERRQTSVIGRETTALAETVPSLRTPIGD
jgi:hypothetical protein